MITLLQQDPPSSPRLGRGGAPAREGSPMKILVVDDATSVRQRLFATLQKSEGVTEVVQAGSGEEALRILEDFQPDLITLDLMLPGMSGLEVLEEIRKTNAEVKVVVFTNYPYPAFRRKCRELGATRFFGKSTEVDRILEVLHESDPQGAGPEEKSPSGS